MAEGDLFAEFRPDEHVKNGRLYSFLVTSRLPPIEAYRQPFAYWYMRLQKNLEMHLISWFLNTVCPLWPPPHPPYSLRWQINFSLAGFRIYLQDAASLVSKVVWQVNEFQRHLCLWSSMSSLSLPPGTAWHSNTERLKRADATNPTPPSMGQFTGCPLENPKMNRVYIVKLYSKTVMDHLTSSICPLSKCLVLTRLRLVEHGQGNAPRLPMTSAFVFAICCRPLLRTIVVAMRKNWYYLCIYCIYIYIYCRE